jgi:hypothetical protein
MSAKITAVTVGVFGFVYHGLLAALLAALLFGTIAPTDIESWFLSVSGRLLILTVAMIFSFRLVLVTPPLATNNDPQ